MLLKVAENPSAYQAAVSSQPQHHNGVLYQQLYMNIIDCLLSFYICLPVGERLVDLWDLQEQ